MEMIASLYGPGAPYRAKCCHGNASLRYVVNGRANKQLYVLLKLVLTRTPVSAPLLPPPK